MTIPFGLSESLCLLAPLHPPVSAGSRRAWGSGVAVILILGMAIGTKGFAQGSLIHLELRPQVEVRAGRVTLADVAQFKAVDAKIQRRLKTLSLGLAPRAGESATVGRDQVNRWIRARVGIDSDQISWVGSRVCRISLATQDVVGNTLAECAQEQLKAHLAKQGLRGEICLTRVPENLRVPIGSLELRARDAALVTNLSRRGEARDRMGGPSLAKRQSVWVEIWVDDRFVRTVPVHFEITVFAPAYVATRRLPAGSRVDASTFAVREVEWSGRTSLPVPLGEIGAPTATGKNGEPPSDLGAAAPVNRLRRPVAEGEPVTRGDVEAAPLVGRGEFATLRTTQGLINLECRVEVLQEGALGEKVRVKIPSASSSIQATVCGRGLVEIRN